MAKLNGQEVRDFCEATNNSNQANVFVNEKMNARCFVAHSANDLSDFLRPENLKIIQEIPNGSFDNNSTDNPLNDIPDLKWIGRPEGIEGVPRSKLTESRISSELGGFRQTDIDLLVKFRQQALQEVNQIDLTEFVAKWRNVESMPAKVNAFRLLNGEPFGRRRMKSKAPRDSIALILPLSASCSVGADVLAAAMSVVVAISEALSDAGFNLELWIANKSSGLYRGAYENGFYAYKLKDPSDPFNDTLVSSGASSWFFRTGIFTLMKTLGGPDVISHLGTPDAVYSNEDKQEILRMLGLNEGHVMAGWPAGSISAKNAMKHMVKEITNALLNYSNSGDDC